MQTKLLPTDHADSAPGAVQDHPDETPTKSPQAFYAKMVKRPEVREILTRLAHMDAEERR